MIKFRKIAIVGIGLIGGSLGLALKKKRFAGTIVGVSRSRQTLRRSLSLKAVDEASQDLSLVKDAQMLILATPVETICTLAPKLREYLNDDCIVTDVGSTKSEIVSNLEKIFPNFVGSHPLAGSEKHGVAFARADLFKDSLCLVTPDKNTDSRALNQVINLWHTVGARTQKISPEEHDKALSLVSHLPHILAFSLMQAVPQEYLKFAARGLRDTTRIAGSDSLLWQDIFLSNRGNILKSIEIFEQKLAFLKKAIQTRDSLLLKKFLEQARKKRDSLL